jgi:hypothetical protein
MHKNQKGVLDNLKDQKLSPTGISSKDDPRGDTCFNDLTLKQFHKALKRTQKFSAGSAQKKAQVRKRQLITMYGGHNRTPKWTHFSSN